MVAGANTALDLCVLELELLLLVVALVLSAGLPVGDGAEVDVLGDTDGVGLGAGGLALLLAELGPALALGDARVDDLLDDRLLDAARCLYLLAVLADVVRGDGLCSVLVLGDLLGRELLLDIAIVLLFGPVGAAVCVLALCVPQRWETGEAKRAGDCVPCYPRHDGRMCVCVCVWRGLGRGAGVRSSVVGVVAVIRKLAWRAWGNCAMQILALR